MQPQAGSIFARKQTSNARPETFAITVTSYDARSHNAQDHRVFGRRLDTNEEVSVSLRDIEYDTTRGFRADIKTLSSPRTDRQHPGTVPGGTLLVQEAFNNDGVYAARWIKVLSHEPGESFTFTANAYASNVMTRGEGRNAKSSAFVSFIHDDSIAMLPEGVRNSLLYTPPFMTENAEDVLNVIEQLLTDEVSVGLRAVAADGTFDAIPVYPVKNKAPREVVDTFVRDTFCHIAEKVDSGELKVEVIPFSTVWAGPKTVQSMATNRSMQSRIGRYNVPSADGRYTQRLYRPSLVTVRYSRPNEENGEQALLITNIEPLNTRTPAYGVEEALKFTKTEFLDPGEPPARQTQSQPSGDHDDSPQQYQQQSSRGRGQEYSNAPDDRPEPPVDSYDDAPAPSQGQRAPQRDFNRAPTQDQGQGRQQQAQQSEPRGFHRPTQSTGGAQHSAASGAPQNQVPASRFAQQRSRPAEQQVPAPAPAPAPAAPTSRFRRA